ncbi:protein kinase [Lentisphaera marina]|uniref:protein kinase domain-containing protein n=1 Tax=Lentisphaera marina TaxID=1111041 RepID=UPI002365EA25|nr:protein kinase [Lentisphaera marina]MDD7984298.1 protein kinase [Lentisphaera marina]
MVDKHSKWNDLFDSLHEETHDNSDERYTQHEEIGRGGSKIIYRASDNLSGREVAFARPLKDDKKIIELFLREARITAYLQHPNILPAYDMNAGDNPYLVCKLLRGSNLSELCSHQQSQRDILPLFRKICEAMNYAHSRGVLHLDLKPENIHLDKYGEVLVIDWGLAEIFLTESHESPLDNPLISTRETLSADNTFCGTPGFMSPEQICNQKVDVRSDIFSLGALLYSMFFIKPPFHADDLKSICAKTQLAELPEFDKQRLSSGLSSIMLKCLQANKDQRYQTVRDLLDDLDAFQNDFIPSAEEANFMHHCKMLYKRNRQSCLLIIASLMVLCLSSLFYIKNITESRSRALSAKSEAILAKEQAESYLKQIINEQKQNEQLSIALSPRYLNIAQEHWHFYELDKAIEYCDLALKVDPNNTEAKNMRAKLYCAYAEYEKAQGLWQEIRSTDEELKLNDYMLKNSHKDSLSKKIMRYKGDSSPVKILKCRILFHEFQGTGQLELLKNIIHISNSQIKRLNLEYSANSFSIQNNSFFINNNFLRGLDIQSLNLQGTKVDNISSLKGKSFDSLNLAHTPLWNLTPLKESKINKLDVSYSYVSGLWHLENCQVKELYINNTKVSSLTKEALASVEVLNIKKTNIRDLGAWPAPVLHTLNIANTQIKNLDRLLAYPALKELSTHHEQLSPGLREALSKKGVQIIQLSSSSKR